MGFDFLPWVLAEVARRAQQLSGADLEMEIVTVR